MACHAKAVDQMLELSKPTRLPSPVIEDGPIINNDPCVIKGEMLIKQGFMVPYMQICSRQTEG